MKKKFFLFFIIVTIGLLFTNSLPALADAYKNTTAARGIGLGSIIAVVVSWHQNKSVLWAIIHAFFSWFYVIYYLLTR